MMYKLLAFDEYGELLTPFRTWRNTITQQASEELSELFAFNIPQRWSTSHLYQIMLDHEDYVNQISFFTTLSGYVHWKLTGEKYWVLKMFREGSQWTSKTKQYHAHMLEQFNKEALGLG